MVKFKDFMDLFVNWGDTTMVTDADHDVMIITDKTQTIMKNRSDLYEHEVVSFDFHANTLMVDIRK